MPRLVIHHAGESARVFELTGDRPLAIGRAKSSNLILDHASVSRTHAIVRSTPDGKWEVIDRASANGVRVNGRVVKEAVLNPSDEIALGEYRIRFEDSQAREVITYGTAQFSPRLAQALRQSSYSSSFVSVEAVADVAMPEGKKRGEVTDHVRSLERENRLLTLLYRVNQSLSELNVVDEITRRVLDFVLEIDGAERGYMMLLDEVSMATGDFAKGAYSFEPAVIRYRGEAGNSPRQATPQLAMSRSIIRQVMKASLPLLVSDATADPRLAASQSIAQGGIQSAMCAPLGMGERLRGLLYVDNLSRRGMFTVDDLNVFGVIAVQAGLAIDRVRGKAPANNGSVQ